MTLNPPVARFDDLRSGGVVQFSSADQVITAETAAEVASALDAVDQAVAEGNWAFGYVAYEAAAGLDPEMVAQDPTDGLPLVWFGISAHPDVAAEPLPAGGGYTLSPWQIDWSEAEHQAQVAKVHQAIAAGDTYQCNLTTRMRAHITGELFGLYADLARGQRGSHHSYLALPRWTVISASPECFFHWQDDLLTTKPMKGTAQRGRTAADDVAVQDQLRASSKDAAENVMIVDLIRNDLSRISDPGSVTVTELLACEKYPTVWHLTSTVESHPAPGTSLRDVFAALFPCGSITGAPKLSTMQLIADLEDSPRGVYCGAVGYLAPGRRQASFSVAIRTVLVDRDTEEASYGVGGGVTWSSTAAGEYAELQAKARVLSGGFDVDLELLETFAVHNGQAANLDHHLDRLAMSAGYFDFTCDRAAIEARVSAINTTTLVRLRLQRDGTVTMKQTPLEPLPEPALLAIDNVAMDATSPFIHHKTSNRDHYAAARARHPDADDVVLINDTGRVTETTIANLAVRIGSAWLTPPLTDGCLPGVGRKLLLAQGVLTEHSLSVDDLLAADEVAVISSARGWRAARVLCAERDNRPVHSSNRQQPTPGHATKPAQDNPASRPPR